LNRLVYLISPNKINKNFYKDLTKVLESKRVSFFQLRLKKISKNKIILISKKIKSICKKFKVKFIINDNPKLASEVKADGCHIGQLDGSIHVARKYMKNKIIGVTCHNSKKLANEAMRNKVEYIAFGAFYKSKLKPNSKKADLKILKWAKKKIKKPIVVIGGINDKNYKKLINSGAKYIAISSFIWNNPVLKPEFAIKKFK
jgi:thiamine-phosphate pyrophosphorylase